MRSTQTDEGPVKPVGSEAAAFSARLAPRDLWVEHIFWVRNYGIANQQGQRKQADTAGT